MIQGTDDYDMVLEINALNSDDSTGNNNIVGDNEGTTAFIFTICSGNRMFLRLRCKNR